MTIDDDLDTALVYVIQARDRAMLFHRPEEDVQRLNALARALVKVKLGLKSAANEKRAAVDR